MAASAVLALESVAILIPIFPAKADRMAPKIKAGTIIQLVVSTTNDIPYNATEAITTKMAKSLYSAPKKASAPSLMALEMPCIFSSPAGCFLTHAILTNMNNNPKTAKAIGRKIILDSINK